MREMYSTGEHTSYALRFERQPNGRYKVRQGRDDERIVVPNVAPPIVSVAEQQAIASRLAANKQFSTRRNGSPEGALLRAGFARCGHCGRAMWAKNRANSDRGPQYNCADGVGCPRPAIRASILDTAVWAKVTEVLRDPQIIAAEVSKHRENGGLERDLAAAQARLARIAGKQARTVKAITTMDDDDSAALLYEELKVLSAQKKATEQECDELQQRLVDAAADAARVKSLSDWCETVSENLDSLTYREKRLALEALGVEVRVWQHTGGQTDGTPTPRWSLMMNPGNPDSSTLLPSTCSTLESAPLLILHCREGPV
jgi:site-specific DNA recombinase